MQDTVGAPYSHGIPCNIKDTGARGCRGAAVKALYIQVSMGGDLVPVCYRKHKLNWLHEA